MLALTGSGEYLPGMEAVDRELIRRLAGARVVCLPTAAGTEDPERIAYWSKLGCEHFASLGVPVEAIPVIDQASANDPAYAARIAAANFVYLSGGKPDYLFQTLRGSLAWQAIRSILDSGGLLAGCSAGAMVLGEKIYGFPGLKPGFDLLHSALIMPHFDEIPSSWVQSLRLLTKKELTLLGIDGYTALVQNGTHYEVLGSGAVTVWNHAGKKRYTQGPLPSWESG